MKNNALKIENRKNGKLIWKMQNPEELVEYDQLNQLTTTELIEIIQRLKNQSKANRQQYIETNNELKQVHQDSVEVLRKIEYMKRNATQTKFQELVAENNQLNEHCRQMS